LTGYLVTLGGSHVLRKTKKQTTVLGSLVETEYRSMAAAMSELVWSKALLAPLGVFHTQAMHLFCGSQAAVHIAKNPVFRKCTKHIKMDCHFVRKRYHLGDLNLFHVSSKSQLADIFKKALRKPQFQYVKSKLGMVNLHVPT